MNQQVPTVDVAAVPDDVVLVDVREPDEWAAGRAPGARNVPLSELLDRLGELPRASTIYLICRSGARSARATAYLNASGWDTINVAGGLQSWQAAGRPLVADSGQPRVV